ncbi:MAG: DUF99 family protein [Desulfobacterales bacterium]|nr:DUF99 family protein [Desulfobacterales bacterium]MBF0396497.1 DUF99 family protein [Desulfobacterales bacterium]
MVIEKKIKTKSFSNVIGFDDCPFLRSHRGDVKIVGTVYAGLRFDGLLTGHIRRDGANSAKVIGELISTSKFIEHIQLIMLQGIAFGGFNVVDVDYIRKCLNIPVLVVARHQPDMEAIHYALLNKVKGGLRKWSLIEKLGHMESLGNVFVQRSGLTLDEATETIRKFAIYGHIPEPLRTAHLIASGINDSKKGSPKYSILPI